MNVWRTKFVRGFGLSSGLIAREGLSNDGYSHVAPMLPDGSHIDARDNVMHAPKVGWIMQGFPDTIPAGVQHRPPQYENWAKQTIVEIPCTEQQASDRVSWLTKHLGAQYDQGAIESFMFGVRLHGDSQFICSALELTCMHDCDLAHAGLIAEWMVPPDTVFMLQTEGLGGRSIYLA